jgi:hypothetical protein
MPPDSNGEADMTLQIVHADVERYMRSMLSRHDEEVLLEMEKEGEERGFPIIGRMVGVTVELLARAIGARRVFELGSGYGYSAYQRPSRDGSAPADEDETIVAMRQRRLGRE